MRRFMSAFGPKRFCRSCRVWVGVLAATCGSTPAGPPLVQPPFVHMRRNWSRSAPMSSWPMAPRPWGRCCRRHAQCQLCSRSSLIIGAGFVDSLARPGRNATGFMGFEYSMGGKWLELLKQIAPGVMRVAVLRGTTSPSGIAQFGVIQAVAPSLRVEVTPVNMRDAGEIESSLAAFARAPSGGLIVTATAASNIYRDLIITLAARQKLPAVYYERSFVAGGGLISYGPDFVDQYRRAAGYVDRILKGEKPGDLPVQTPTKFELVINLKTAKALGLSVPPSLLASANDVIE